MQTTDAIPATPRRPGAVAVDHLPDFLTDTPLATLAAEFVKLGEQHRQAAAEHKAIANQAALDQAHADDRAAHGTALRAGKSDPGPRHTEAWAKQEQEARRAVEGAGEALLGVWRDLLAALADDNAGGAIQQAENSRADAIRKELVPAVAKVRALLAELDTAAFRATWTTKARLYAIEQQRPGFFHGNLPARWPTSGAGHEASLIVHGRPAPVDEVMRSVEAYRAE